MTENLLRFDNKQKYIVADFETNSLNLVKTLPWQLAWIVCEGKNVIKRIERKIWWENYEIDDQISIMNHFDRLSYNKEAVDPMDVLNEFETYVYDPQYLIIGQNFLNYDVFIHNNLRKKFNKKSDFSYLERIRDTRAFAMAIAKNAKTPPKNDIMSWQYSWLNHYEKSIKTTQLSLLKLYNIPFDQSRLHDALYDDEMTFEIFKKQIWEVEI